ncbi:unnamed protein product [Schistosoma margrebowiei]|uniref:Uncharacterized protein n=1 Tax=Schistosoma margrebowiei TaxID=48269 RepID=A0A183ML32_9TREM|nr:unnamed protein product [Schistosoma margrebowiei]
MVVRGSQQETLDPSFVLFGTRQQGVPVILRELVLPGGLDLVSPRLSRSLDKSRSLQLHLIAQAGSYQDSVAKSITRGRFKRTVLGSRPRVNINCGMQVHSADESQIGQNARQTEFHY